MKLRRIAFIGVLIALSVAAVAYTFTAAVQFSAFAASVFKVAIVLALYEAADRFLLDEYDTVAQLKKGNVAVAIAMLALAILLAPAVASGQPAGHSPDSPPVVDTAQSYVGVTEQPPGSNEGDAVEMFLASVDLGEGYAWCAAFVSYVLDAADAKRPAIRSAGATDFLDARRTIDATDALRGTESVPAGALSVHRRGNSWKGHIGIVRYWQRQCGGTIEGNTSPGEAGSQRDGQGVWPRRRCLTPGSYFRIVGFVPTSS